MNLSQLKVWACAASFVVCALPVHAQGSRLSNQSQHLSRRIYRST